MLRLCKDEVMEEAGIQPIGEFLKNNATIETLQFSAKMTKLQAMMLLSKRMMKPDTMNTMSTATTTQRLMTSTKMLATLGIRTVQTILTSVSRMKTMARTNTLTMRTI